MTLTQKLLGVASFGLAFVTASFAQEAAAAETTTASLLGVRYVEAGFGVVDLNGSDRGIYSVGVKANIPVTANLDLSASYAHDWVENNDSIYSNVASVDATAYLTEGAFRPFATAGVGYVWESNAVPGSDDYGIWNVGAGVEYSINTTTAVTAGVNFSDTFEDEDDSGFAGSVRLSHWFTSAIAGTIGATWFEGGNFGYSASAVFKF